MGGTRAETKAHHRRAPRLSRRTITKGAAWATPLLVTAVAAPAYAASGPCVAGQARSPTTGPLPPSRPHSSRRRRSRQRSGGPLDGGCRQRPTRAKPARSIRTEFAVAPSHPNWNYLKLHLPEGMTQGDTVTLTLSFSQPVTGLVAHDHRHRQGHRTPGSTRCRSPRRVHDLQVSEQRTSSARSRRPPTRSRSNQDGGIDSIRSDVTLTWAAPVTSRCRSPTRQPTFRTRATSASTSAWGRSAFTC